LCHLGEEAARLLSEDQTLLAFLYQLMKRQLYRDAVGMLACALPRRQGVWWAWHCARSLAESSSSPNATAALAATQAWLANPDENNRKACGDAAVEAGPGTPAGSAALAAFWSAGTLGAANRSVGVPAEDQAAQAVACAVVLAAHEGQREKASERFYIFLREGIALLSGLFAVRSVPPAS
jgi:hypothetical protein